MSAPPIDPGPDPTDLEAALRDLGAHLDLGPATTDDGRATFVGAVLDRLDAAPTDLGRARRRRTARRVLAAAAVVVVVLAGLLAVTPTREAIARWLGIGAIGITGRDELRPEGDDPAPGSPTNPSGTSKPGPVDLDAIGAALPFAIRLPDPALTGELLEAEVDASVPVGLVELRYDAMTIVEVGSRRDAPSVLGKVLPPGTTTTPVTVAGREGLWLTGDPHQVASMDPDGQIRLDTVRRAGDVLIWEDAGVTYRIEGAPSLDAALAIAASLR